jgi:hypothetical protein
MYTDFSLPTGHDEPVFSIQMMTKEEFNVLYSALKIKVQERDFKDARELELTFAFIKKMEINKHLPSKQITAIDADDVCGYEFMPTLQDMVKKTNIKL